jgi:uncharacterized membrane protein YqaE (UPF0057 family)
MVGQSICTTCGFVGEPIRVTPGHFCLELALWFLLLIPGMIYSVWRVTHKALVCPKCKNPTMIPLDSPVGRDLLAKQKPPLP